MSDLQIDFASLEAMNRSLIAVAGRFEELTGQTTAEPRIWGGSHVRSAMEEFAGNWESHRRKLTEDARKLGEHCAVAVEVFRGVDSGLARSVQGPSPR